MSSGGSQGIKRYFASSRKASDGNSAADASSTPKRQKTETVDLTDDEPKKQVIDLTLSDEEDKAPKMKTSPTKSPAKPPAKSPAKSPAKKAKQTEPLKIRPDSEDAASILQSIPDAVLPDVDPSQKPNFRQIMEARQNHAEPAGDGGSFDVEAKPDCLLGLTFVVTGQLPTLGREEIQGIIKRYGGNVTSSLSGKTSCLILGSDAGPSKISKAKSLKLKVIDEDGFKLLLQSMPSHGGSGLQATKALEKKAKDEELAKAEAKRLVEATKPKSSAKSGSNVEHDLWTSRYAPKNLSEICGNNAPVKRLNSWLANWLHAHKTGFVKTPGVEGSEFRAAMLSGPPGIGKTTAAHLVAESLGFDVIEYNASDTRSKSLLQQHVTQTLGNRSIFSDSNKREKPICVVMDEVDGMSGGDRGGVGAMAAMARSTNVPLILICNERNLPKMRPFDRVTFDIPFRRPDSSAIRNRVIAIAAAQGLKLDATAVDQLVQVTRSDIRQILVLLSTFATTAKQMDYDHSRSFTKSFKKEVILKPFDIVGKYLSRAPMDFNEKIELYFNDYDLAPLMVQENYLQTAPKLLDAMNAAESISDGDLVDRCIHGPQQQWSLMPLHAVLSCVIPSAYAAGQSRGRFNFPGFLGNNSKATKYKRLLAEVRSHMRLRLSANMRDLRLEYHPVLVDRLLNPLLSKQQEGIDEIIEFMDNYFLTREDWDVVMELGVGPKSSENRAKTVPTNVKSAFTRKYNSSSHPLPFMKSVDAKSVASQAKRGPAPDLEDVIEDDVDVPDVVDDKSELTLEEQIASDKYIKPLKGKPKKAAAGVTKKAPAKKRAKK